MWCLYLYFVFNVSGKLPNRNAPRKMNPRYGSRKSCWPKDTNPALWENHFDLDDPNHADEVKKFSQECWANYKKNLQQFSHLKHLENNCIFHFLSFFLTESFVNTTFLAHNGAR